MINLSSVSYEALSISMTILALISAVLIIKTFPALTFGMPETKHYACFVAGVLYLVAAIWMYYETAATETCYINISQVEICTNVDGSCSLKIVDSYQNEYNFGYPSDSITVAAVEITSVNYAKYTYYKHPESDGTVRFKELILYATNG